jgi:metal-responsive CopG/Arc/MetJ family transcriptional regulator
MTRRNRVPVVFNDLELEKLDFVASKEGANRSETLRKLTEREYQRLQAIEVRVDTED